MLLLLLLSLSFEHRKKTYFHSCSHRGKSDVITKNIHLLTLSTTLSRKIWKERNIVKSSFANINHIAGYYYFICIVFEWMHNTISNLLNYRYHKLFMDKTKITKNYYFLDPNIKQNEIKIKLWTLLFLKMFIYRYSSPFCCIS